jgi:tRNA modification GTPase
VGSIPPSDLESHTQHLGQIIENGSVIDQAMLAVHRAPQSYTGEDLIEISLPWWCAGHGQGFWKPVCGRGARPARPGEFTERAYLNGRIDLTRPKPSSI